MKEHIMNHFENTFLLFEEAKRVMLRSDDMTTEKICSIFRYVIFCFNEERSLCKVPQSFATCDNHYHPITFINNMNIFRYTDNLRP